MCIGKLSIRKHCQNISSILLFSSVAHTAIAQTTSFEVGALPLVANADPIPLATLTLTETSANAWQDGTFTIQWNGPYLDFNRKVTFLESSTASGSVGSPAIAETAQSYMVVNVDANASEIDSITVQAMVEVAFFGPGSDATLADFIAFNGSQYTIFDGDAPRPEPGPDTDPGNFSNISEAVVTLTREGRTFDIYAGPSAWVHQGVSFSREIITANGSDRGPYDILIQENDPVDASVNGGQLNVTAGTELGFTSMIVFDRFGLEAPLGVEVIEEGTFPPVAELTTNDGSATTATMELGAAPANEPTYLQTFESDTTITISGAIQPEIADRGLRGEIFVAGRVTGGTLGNADQYYYQNPEGNFILWDERSAFPPAIVRQSLSADERFVIYSGPMPIHDYEFFIGYQVEGGPLIYSETPLPIRILPPVD